MSEDKKVPEIRFAGFTDAWEQRKLGDVATFINGRAYSQPELLSSGKYKVLRVGNFYTNDSWYYSDLELGEKYYADYGDLLYTWSATFGPHIWLGDRVIYHYHIWKIDLSNQLEKQFAVQLLEQDKANILSSKNGSTMVHITKEGMEQKDVIIPPSTKEQQEIGAFFQQLDNLITLHQRKHEKLVVLKRAMLEKMFPQNGSNIPEVRFSGFTGPWEQRKASELADFSKGYGYSKGDLKETGTPIILYGRLYTKYQFEIGEVDTFSDIKPGSVFSQGDEVIVPASGETAEDIAIAAAVVEPGILLGGDLNILHPFGYMNPSFVALSISNGQPKRELAKKAQGKSVVHIHNSDIQEVTISYPDKGEQDKIVSFFSRLDNLIALNHREYESLKHVKAALLQKMFV